MEGAIEMSYKAGDKVWVDCDNTHKNLKGRLPGVVIGPCSHPMGCNWKVEIEGHPGEWYTWEKSLSPRRDPDEYDGNQAARWDDCPWQPELVPR
jgi:hypothetical protein